MRVFVLPVPGPARTIRGCAGSATTADLCAAFKVIVQKIPVTGEGVKHIITKLKLK
jgi:hypothetical protein